MRKETSRSRDLRNANYAHAARGENAQREIIALSITLMTEAEAKMGATMACVCVCAYIHQRVSLAVDARDKGATLSYRDENNAAVKFPVARSLSDATRAI